MFVKDLPVLTARREVENPEEFDNWTDAALFKPLYYAAVLSPLFLLQDKLIEPMSTHLLPLNKLCEVCVAEFTQLRVKLTPR